MTMARLQQKSKIYSPAAVGAGETAAVFSVPKGLRVWACSMIVLTAAAASTDTTIGLGDGTSTVGYIAATDLEVSVAGTLVNGQGALLNQSGGKLYTVADTIDALYAGATFGAVLPKVQFTIVYSREWPGPGPA